MVEIEGQLELVIGASGPGLVRAWREANLLVTQI